MLRLGLLGTFVWDRIWHPGSSAGRPREQWGGLAYSLAAAAAVCPEGWEVVPIAHVGADLAPSLFDFVGSLPNLSPRNGLRVVAEANNRVELRYLDQAERTERLSGNVGSWSIEELLPIARHLDALYINFISGFEMDVATAARLRAEVDIPIFADLHSLFLGAPGRGPRTPRRLPDWSNWLGCFDAVQLNESELELLGPDGRSAEQRLLSIPAQGLGLGLVTRGPRGASAARDTRTIRFRAGLPSDAGNDDGSTVYVIDIPANEVVEGDPTGCGDVWGTVVFAGLLQELPLETAISRAHDAAAAKMRCVRIDELRGRVAAKVARYPAP